MFNRQLILWAILLVSPIFVQQECSAQDSDVAVQVREILKDLDELQEARKSGEIEWEWKLIEAIELGPEAVPELIRQLDDTPIEERRMLRTIPFILRGIGDRRAIPALIRAIPKCYGNDGSDMGYRCDDPELFKLLQKYDNSDRADATHYSYGRPINEVFRTLEKWTGQKLGWTELAFIHDGGTPRQKLTKRKLFEAHARRWEQWWLKNWQTYTDDAGYSRVDLPEFEPQDAVEYEFDRKKPLNRYSGLGNGIMSSYLEPSDNQSRRVFHDLDTERKSPLPAKWGNLTEAELQAAQQEIRKWAIEEGFDLMGVTVERDGKKYYVIENLSLEAWQLPESLNKFNNELAAEDFITSGRKVKSYLAWFDDAQNDYDFDRRGTFFYITNDGTPGLLTLGIEVHDTNVKIGGFFDGDDNLNPVGFYKGRRFSLSYAE